MTVNPEKRTEQRSWFLETEEGRIRSGLHHCPGTQERRREEVVGSSGMYC